MAPAAPGAATPSPSSWGPDTLWGTVARAVTVTVPVLVAWAVGAVAGIVTLLATIPFDSEPSREEVLHASLLLVLLALPLVPLVLALRAAHAPLAALLAAVPAVGVGLCAAWLAVSASWRRPGAVPTSLVPTDLPPVVYGYATVPALTAATLWLLARRAPFLAARGVSAR